MKNMLKGFTLIEIMIVVAIIAILAALAIPSFMTYRQQSQATACISNLSQIRNATELYLMSHTAAPSALSELVGSDKQIKNTPVCPAGGGYTVGDATTDPTCSFTGSTDYPHQLPADTAASSGT